MGDRLLHRWVGGTDEGTVLACRTCIRQSVRHLYETDHAIVIGFVRQVTETPPPIRVGATHLRHIDWHAYPELEAEDAASHLAGQVEDWRGGIRKLKLAAVAG